MITTPRSSRSLQRTIITGTSTTCLEPPRCVLFGNPWKGPRDGLVDGIMCPWSSLLDEVFELCPGQFDGVEFERIGWKKQDGRAFTLDEVSDGFGLVCPEVVHDHDVAGPKMRTEEMLNKGFEGLPSTTPLLLRQGVFIITGLPSQLVPQVGITACLPGGGLGTEDRLQLLGTP